MADGYHFENFKIAVSLQPFEMSQWNLARWCTTPLCMLPKLENSDFEKLKMSDGHYFNNFKSPYICNCLTCCDKFWAVMHGKILQPTESSKFIF